MQYQVQYLRAVAALCVFYYHIAANLKNSGNVYVPAVYEVGSAGVDLFFVISGYIMAKIIWEKPFATRAFIGNRLWRIVPLYWTATLVVFLIAVFAPFLLGSTKADIGQLIHSLFFIANGANPQTSSPTLVIGWTLNYEIFFYALIVICVGLLRDKSLFKTALLLCAITAFGKIYQPVNGYLLFYTDPIILEFAFGIAVFHAIRTQGTFLSPAIAYPILVISLAIMVFTTATQIDNHRVLLWGIPSALALYAGLSALNFKNNLFKRLGDWSYEIYILHVFIIAGGIKFLLPHLSALNLPSPTDIILFVAILTVLIVVVAAIANRFFAYCVPKLQNHVSPKQQKLV